MLHSLLLLEEIFRSSLAANYVRFAINYICNETFSGLLKWVQLLLYFPHRNFLPLKHFIIKNRNKKKPCRSHKV